MMEMMNSGRSTSMIEGMTHPSRLACLLSEHRCAIRGKTGSCTYRPGWFSGPVVNIACPGRKSYLFRHHRRLGNGF
jgi:hypothetical protein